MGIGRKSLKGHLPILFGDDLTAVINALGLSFDRLRDFLRGVLTESNPGTAIDTLPEWYYQLGLTYDATLPLDARQKQARQKNTATGGQYLNYLNEQIQIAFPLVEIIKITLDESNMCGIGEAGDMECEAYPSWLPIGAQDGSEPVGYYLVTGELDNDEDLSRLDGLLQRIAPAEMEPVYQVTVLSDSDTSQAGVAVCGYAECNAE